MTITSSAPTQVVNNMAIGTPGHRQRSLITKPVRITAGQMMQQMQTRMDNLEDSLTTIKSNQQKQYDRHKRDTKSVTGNGGEGVVLVWKERRPMHYHNVFSVVIPYACTLAIDIG